MIRAVILDLDGTIIGPGEKISPAVHRAVSKLAARVPVSIATGRETSDVIKYSRQLQLDTPQICDGGATILDPVTTEILWRTPLGEENARKVLGRLKTLGTAFIATFPQGSARDYSQLPHWDLTRISALDMPESMADEIAGWFPGDGSIQTVKAYLPYNGLWAVDFTHRGVDKGTAAGQLARLLDVDTSEIAAAGDSFNDLALLRACGLGIAMGNAAPEIKEMADYLAPAVDDDGLAVAIEEFLLPRL